MTPMSAMTDDQIERLARRRAGARLGWMIHATVYVAVNLALATAALAAGRHWHLYPLLGWGLGLALHGAAVFLFGRGSPLYERLVEHERQRLHGVR